MMVYTTERDGQRGPAWPASLAGGWEDPRTFAPPLTSTASPISAANPPADSLRDMPILLQSP